MDESLGRINYGTNNNIYSKYSNQYIGAFSDESDSSVDGNYLDFDSYLQLLVAQMQNQDFNDPMSDSEVLAQMAQYSMLEGIKNMTQQSNVSYTMSLVGKVVTVDMGQSYLTGKVDSVTIYNGEPSIIINGNAYKSSQVSDIVDPEIYSQLKDLLGKTVRTLTSLDEDSVTGKVTDILFLYGESYVLVGDQVYPAKNVEVVEDSEDGSEDQSTDNVHEADGTDSAEEAAGSGAVPDTEDAADEEVNEESSDIMVDEVSDVIADNRTSTIANGYSASAADVSYLARSQEIIDSLMTELDGISGIQETGETASANADYILKTTYLQAQEYKAGVMSNEDILEYFSAGREGGVSHAGEIPQLGDHSDVAEEDMAPGYDQIYSGYGTEEYVADLDPNNAEKTENGNYKGVSAPPATARGDGVPRRISVEDYPEEAALADELGTRMYDIRFIYNTDITSRINTDRIWGYTKSGKAITEIGYSGVGQLGEVVTFSDGTQRVEILLNNGNSGWLFTTGNYTLDEICDKNAEPGSLAGKLTESEVAIRHFSDPFSEIDKSPLMAFENYLKAQGHA